MQLSRPLILASTSPRRQFLMKEAGFQFEIARPEGDESFPPDMPVESIPSYLAEKKAQTFKSKIKDEIVLTADTVVILGHTILNKPRDRDEAVQMLTSLS